MSLRASSGHRDTVVNVYAPMPSGGWRGWLGPLLAGAAAAALRLPQLGTPHAIAFDETYYAKDALSLLLYGHERQTVEGANETLLAGDGSLDTLDIFKDAPSYVVHPPLGKWLIASGEHLFGATPFGWRIAMAVIGVAMVVMLARIVRRLTRSNLLGTIAGLLLALDGMAIVLSRIALLDGALAFFVLAAFGALLLDRDRTRRLYPARTLHPWRWAAAFLLGGACAVKWSGLWYVAAFGLLAVCWDLGLRRATGQDRPWSKTLVRDALPSAVIMLVIVLTVYLASWYGWFTTGGYLRSWAVDNGGSPGLWSSLRSLWHYHAEAWRFHTTLSSEHSYMSNAWGWPLQARPTSFYYESDGVTCGAQRCSAEVLALGNPLIWWAGAAALCHQVWRWAAARDWRSGAVLCGFLAGWAPWLLFQERTVFTFYSIVFLPFTIMALTLSLGAVMGSPELSRQRRRSGTLAVLVYLLAVVAVSWWFYPIWTGQPIPYEDWNLRMWFPTWV